MALSDIGTIKSILSKHGFTFSKEMGQNFLINPSVCPRMAESSVQNDNTGVLEIGPGIGVLTCELAKRARKVVCIELDKRLIPVLGETLSEFDNVTVINSDVLKIDLHKVIEEHFSGMDVVVCANLPYYITSPIIMSLLESRLPIKTITVMVQKEAAERLCAQVGERKSGAVTVAVNYYSIAKKLFDVSRGSFMPAPNVDSSVIQLEIRNEQEFKVDDECKFFRIVRAAFQQRRKTVSNSISSVLGVKKSVVADALKACGIKETARAEELTMEDLFALSENINM
ncbi:MAG: 16S rRNA (adenine(1518)-N(6)/adenine(1519)-N(6))-dimethyltransferase RsmA [Clostridia bacterium]|nr:16S rRNA (adenine(1518)-N(6)/adenine(1519)-N(6))-dimethyltransferase RsmA [Clostridia bacterium]